MKSKKILLVYPKYPPTFWSFHFVLHFIGKLAAYYPYGLTVVAAMLPQNWKLKLVDMNVKPLRDKDIEKADMVFISAMVIQTKSVKDVIKRCRKIGTPIVAGGPLFSSDPSFDVDHRFVGEAENLMPEFLADCANDTLKPVYKASEKPDLSEINVLPRLDLLDLKKYATALVLFSQGCPHDCEFCGVTALYGRRSRTKNLTQIMAELDALSKNWVGTVFIGDDNFIGNPKNAKEILREIIKWQKKHKYPFKFIVQVTTIVTKDQEMLELMRDANVASAFLGIENPNEEVLKECKKFQNVGVDLSEVIRTLHRYGIKALAGMILGFDHDDERSFQRIYDFIQSSGLTIAMLGLLNALKGTALYSRMKREHRLEQNPDSSGNNLDATINFIPRMNKATLVNGYRDLLERLYRTDVFVERVKKMLEDFQPSIRSRFSFRDLKAFFHIVGRMGLASKNRKYFWDLVVYTLTHKINAFTTVMELICLHYHFQKISLLNFK